MKHKRLDLIAMKFVTFDIDSFVQEAITYSKNSMIICFDIHKITLRYKPPDVSFPWNNIRLFSVDGRRRHGLTALMKSVLNIFLFIFLTSYLCVRYRPKVFWSHNLWSSWPAGIFRKIGMCDYTIHVASDWLVSDRKQTFVSHLANNIVFPIFDYLGCVLSDLVLNSSEKISESRTAYWGKEVDKHRIDYPVYMKIHADINKRERNRVCFLGLVRNDSGLEFVIPLLCSLWEKHGIKLVVVGWESPHLEKIKKMMVNYNAQECVEFHGYLDYGKLHELLDGCFCGLNLLTTTDSYSTYGIPGKLVDYLQMLMPVIVTDGVGPFAEVVREKELGFVIESTEELSEAVEELYCNNAIYQKNIQDYILSRSAQKMSDYIKV